MDSKFYRLIFIDSGNDESDPMWLRMIEDTDQLVVATTTEDDRAESVALLLETLEAGVSEAAALADNAVVVVSQSDSTASKPAMENVRAGFEPPPAPRSAFPTTLQWSMACSATTLYANPPNAPGYAQPPLWPEASKKARKAATR